MIGFSRNNRKKLESKYKQLMEESYRLSHSDRKKSDEKRAEAEEVKRQLDQLAAEGK